MKSLCERCKFYSEKIIHVEEKYGDGWNRKERLCGVMPEAFVISGNLSECNFYKEKNLTKKEKSVIINQGDKSGSKKKKQKKK